MMAKLFSCFSYFFIFKLRHHLKSKSIWAQTKLTIIFFRLPPAFLTRIDITIIVSTTRYNKFTLTTDRTFNSLGV
jgi:hypothetical protein